MDIRTVTSPTREELEKILVTSEPVLIKGIVDRWPAFRKWTMAYLRERMGHRMLDVCETETGEHRLHVSHPTKISGRDLIDSYLSSDPKVQQRYHLTQVRLLDDAPSLVGDIAWPECIRIGKIFQICFWMAAEHTRTCLHWDGLPAVLSLVMGEKDFGFFPPEEAENLYPNELTDHPFLNRSQVDVFAPDLEKHPRFAKLRPLEVRLSAGDMLFVPPYWWHYVRNRTPVAAVRFEFSGYPSAVSFFNDRRRLVARDEGVAHQPWLRTVADV